MGGFSKLKWYVQLATVVAVCGALLAGVWYWFMSPIQMDIRAQTARLAEVTAKVDKSLRQKAVFEQFKKEAEVLQARLDELKRVLPQDRETDQILKQVQSSASGSGLKIQSGVSRAPVDHEVYTEYPLEMSVIGTPHTLGEFLEKIRRLDRIVNIDKLKIDGRASEGEASYTASIGASYEAKTYVYREQVADKVPAATAVKVKK